MPFILYILPLSDWMMLENMAAQFIQNKRIRKKKCASRDTPTCVYLVGVFSSLLRLFICFAGCSLCQPSFHSDAAVWVELHAGTCSSCLPFRHTWRICTSTLCVKKSRGADALQPQRGMLRTTASLFQRLYLKLKEPHGITQACLTCSIQWFWSLES